MSKDTNATLQLVKDAMAKADPTILHKAWTQSGSATSGITAYDLEAPAKKLYPVITPLRNMIPRVSGKGGIQANWRAVTGINTTNINPGVSQGNRSRVITTSTADYTAAYKALGLEDYVTFEAEYAGEGFDDVKALAVQGLLESTMIAEEFVLLGGNNSLALGNTPAATLSSGNTGGTLTGNVSYGVGVVALTLDAYLAASVAGGIVQRSNYTNTDGSADIINRGTALPSVQANVTTAAGANTRTIAATVTAVAGAVAYAWFWGAASGNLSLGAITTINSVSILAAATGTQSYSSLVAADYSRNDLVFDGLLTFASTSALNSYRYVMPTGNAGSGTPLTADGKGGVVEIDAALKSFWDLYRLSPDTIWVNSQEQKTISTAVLEGSANGASRFVFNVDQGVIAGGTLVRSYLNRYTMNGAQEIPIKLHPNVPPGTILFTTAKLPYPMSNVGNVMQVRNRREYYQIEWPLRTRKYEYGVYCDEVLQHFFPPSLGIITNIAPSV